MLLFNIEVLTNILKDGITIERNLLRKLSKLFVVEESKERRKAIYEIIRDTYYHEFLLVDCLRSFKGEIPEDIRRNELNVFEEMFTTQKMAILRESITVIRDFYEFFHNDLKNSNLESFMDKEKAEKILSTIETILKAKEEHLKKVEEIGEFI